MNVDEASALHRRYVDVSHRFRASWVFHQFAQSLQKVFDGGQRENHAEEFQELYAELRDVSQSLTASEAAASRLRLDEIEPELGRLTRILVEEDSRVPPDRLRQFFHRFPRYEDKILLQLSRFLIYAACQDGWTPDRLDKLDFLLTRAAQQEREGAGYDRFVLGDRRSLRELLSSLWSLTGADRPPQDRVEQLTGELESIRREADGLDSLDALNGSGLLDRFRSLKHRLGPLLLEPQMLMAILETNLQFKNLVGDLYRREERRIVADYQRVFDLESSVPVDVQLERELTEFRRQIERFEQRLQRDDFRLGDLASIRQRVRELLPRLEGTEASPSRGGDFGTPDTAPVAEPGRGRWTKLRDDDPARRERDEIDEALEEIPVDDSPRAVTLRPEIFPLGLEPREVLAWRRVKNGDSQAYDLKLEEFLLSTAALRLHLKRLVDEIQALLDDTARDWEAPVYGKARTSLRAGGARLAHFDQWVFQSLQDGQGTEARALEVPRMRLMREYSGLWLLAYKPYLETVPDS